MPRHHKIALKPKTIRMLMAMDWEVVGDTAICHEPPELIDNQDFYNDLEDAGVKGAFCTDTLEIAAHALTLLAPGWDMPKKVLDIRGGFTTNANPKTLAKNYLKTCVWHPGEKPGKVITTQHQGQSTITQSMLELLDITSQVVDSTDKITLQVSEETLRRKTMKLNGKPETLTHTNRLLRKPGSGDKNDLGL